LILRRGYRPEIFNSVVLAVAIDVVYLMFWPTFVVQRPDNDVGKDFSTEETAGHHSIRLDNGKSWCSSKTRIENASLTMSD